MPTGSLRRYVQIRRLPRQAGISFLLIDLHSPGVRVRPITTIANDDDLAGYFSTMSWCLRENLMGKLHEGWRIANALLGHERLATSNPQFSLISRLRAVMRLPQIPL